MRDRFAKLSKNKKVYIIPTKFGMALFLSVIFMLMAGAAYGNNLVNLLGFFLAAIGFVTMIQTHNNVRSVSVLSAQVESGYTNTPLKLTTIVEATDHLDHFHLEADLEGLTAQPRLDFSPILYAKSKAKFHTSFSFTKRGEYKFNRVQISSVYPLGLFYAWSFHAISGEFFVYPTPSGTRDLPLFISAHHSETGTRARFSGEDYREHRTYQPTDSARHVDWKAFARGRPLLTKRFDESGPEAVELNWSSTPQKEVESKLSQLSLWIEIAHRSERSFALQLPQTRIDFGNDYLHAQRCLKELAKFSEISL